MVAALLIVAGVAATETRAGAQAAPTLTVTPNDELLDGEPVSVTGTGFLPNSTVYIIPCPAGATTVPECDTSLLPDGVQTDAAGSFSADHVAQRFIQGQIGGVPTDLDCAVDPCVLGAGDLGLERTAFAPIDFADGPVPQPTINITPSDGLSDGEEVQVVGTGFRPQRSFELRQCRARCNVAGTL